MVHTFEVANLGKAPFYLSGVRENKFTPCPGAPSKPGGSCDYCGASILYEFLIRSADGKLFKVGSDCVAKTEDAGLRRVVDAKVRQLKRDATHKRQDALIARGLELFARPDVQAAMAAQPDLSGRNGSLAGQLGWYFKNAGRAGKSWAARKVIVVAESLPKAAAA